MKWLRSSSADHRGRSSTPAWRTRLIAVGCAALLIAGCGGDEDPDAGGTTVADGRDEADGDIDDVETESSQQDAEADPQGDSEDDDDAGVDDGPAEHRPPSDVTADCDEISEPSPGAVIVFPSADDPRSLEAGPGPVTVEVIGCSDTFEANLQYEAFHGQDTSPTLSGFTQGGTLGDWGAFGFEETYWTPGEWTVVVFDDDAESGKRMEFDEVTFTVD